MEIEVDLWEEVRRLLPLLEACEEIEPTAAATDEDQGMGLCRPV